MEREGRGVCRVHLEKRGAAGVNWGTLLDSARASSTRERMSKRKLDAM